MNISRKTGGREREAAGDYLALFIYIFIAYGCRVRGAQGARRWQGTMFLNRLAMITESGGHSK